MWKFVLPPVLIVATLWIAMSSATTFYVHWIEESHRRVFDEYVVSIEAANDIQRSARRLESMWPTSTASILSVRPLWNETFKELEAQGKLLRSLSHSTTERDKVVELEAWCGQIRELANAVILPDVPIAVEFSTDELTSSAGKLQEIVKKVSSLASELKAINQRIIHDAAVQRSRIGNLVLIVRLSMLFAGPLLGIWFGWRLSRRLQNSVGRIAVTLQQSDARDIDLGTVTLRSDGILTDLQQQAEKIVVRLRDAHRDLESAQSEIVRSERLAAVGQLAAGVAHELRNPLTSVKLLLQHAARNPSAQALNESKLQLILDEIDRMESTIEGLLDFSRQRPLLRTPHDLSQTLQRALNLVEGRARQQGVSMEVRRAPEPLIVDGDAECLHQVFVNLLINAIDAMPDGGCLSVKVSSSADANLARIEIRDTGTGLQEQVLPRLFEPFATTKERGTGMGLAVSRRIIDQHNGSLIAANHPEGGAIFTVELPLKPPAIGPNETLKEQALQRISQDN